MVLDFFGRAQGLVCIFTFGEDNSSPRSSPRRQRSSALHLAIQVLYSQRKTAIAKAIAVFLAGAQGLEP